MYLDISSSIPYIKSLAIKAFNVGLQLYFLETTFSTLPFLLVSQERGSIVFSTTVCCIFLEIPMTAALLLWHVPG